MTNIIFMLSFPVMFFVYMIEGIQTNLAGLSGYGSKFLVLESLNHLVSQTPTNKMASVLIKYLRLV